MEERSVSGLAGPDSAFRAGTFQRVSEGALEQRAGDLGLVRVIRAARRQVALIECGVRVLGEYDHWRSVAGSSSPLDQLDAGRAVSQEHVHDVEVMLVPQGGGQTRFERFSPVEGVGPRSQMVQMSTRDEKRILVVVDQQDGSPLRLMRMGWRVDRFPIRSTVPRCHPRSLVEQWEEWPPWAVPTLSPGARLAKGIVGEVAVV